MRILVARLRLRGDIATLLGLTPFLLDRRLGLLGTKIKNCGRPMTGDFEAYGAGNYCAKGMQKH